MTIWLPSQMLMAGAGRFPLTLVQSLLTAADQTDTAQWNNIPFVAPATPKRYCIAAVSAREDTTGLINLTSVTWGSALSPIETAYRGTGSTAVLSEIWGGFVPTGSLANLTIGLNKSASSTENFDSIGVSLLVTNLLNSGTPVDFAEESGSGSSITVDNLDTTLDGIAIGLTVTTAPNQAVTSLVGNAGNGALAELVDSGVESNHRHALYVKAVTAAATAEDFTSTAPGPPLSHVCSMASWY